MRSAAVAQRFPSMSLPYFSVEPSLWFGFDLVRHVRLEDARGCGAAVFAELDGTIVVGDNG